MHSSFYTIPERLLKNLLRLLKNNQIPVEIPLTTLNVNQTSSFEFNV